jgi:hypothetical protein
MNSAGTHRSSSRPPTVAMMILHKVATIGTQVYRVRLRWRTDQATEGMIIAIEITTTRVL